jgi:hypothetical protein
MGLERSISRFVGGSRGHFYAVWRTRLLSPNGQSNLVVFLNPFYPLKRSLDVFPPEPEFDSDSDSESKSIHHQAPPMG